MVYSEMIWIHEKGFHIWYDEGIPPTTSGSRIDIGNIIKIIIIKIIS